MSYDPDRPLAAREPDVSGPWRPPRISRGPINPPETYRKANAKVKMRDIHPSRWTRKTVYREMPVGSIVASSSMPRTRDYPVGARWVGHTRCPRCLRMVPEVIHQLPTVPRGQEWVCMDCTPRHVLRLNPAKWDVYSDKPEGNVR